jgi:cyclopropane fatty-acyl-phospholipid synthase-like methyltransferase
MTESRKVNETILHHDTGKPQNIIIELVDSGEIKGKVLEIGCGTGENSLHIAGAGHPALGIDPSKEAVLIAKQKSEVMLARRGICARFKQFIPQNLGLISESFNAIIDHATFQTIPTEERETYASSMVPLLEPGGSIILIITSTSENLTVRSESDVIKAVEHNFPQDFCIKNIREILYETGHNEVYVKGWECSITRGETIHATSIAE